MTGAHAHRVLAHGCVWIGAVTFVAYALIGHSLLLIPSGELTVLPVIAGYVVCVLGALNLRVAGAPPTGRDVAYFSSAGAGFHMLNAGGVVVVALSGALLSSWTLLTSATFLACMALFGLAARISDRTSRTRR